MREAETTHRQAPIPFGSRAVLFPCTAPPSGLAATIINNPSHPAGIFRDALWLHLACPSTSPSNRWPVNDVPVAQIAMEPGKGGGGGGGGTRRPAHCPASRCRSPGQFSSISLSVRRETVKRRGGEGRVLSRVFDACSECLPMVGEISVVPRRALHVEKCAVVFGCPWNFRNSKNRLRMAVAFFLSSGPDVLPDQ